MRGLGLFRFGRFLGLERGWVQANGSFDEGLKALGMRCEKCARWRHKIICDYPLSITH